MVNKVKDLMLFNCEILRLRLRMTRIFKPRIYYTFNRVPC
jgi:hypothetical protein